MSAGKFATYAQYEQEVVAFDWAIDSVRGRIGDRTVRDYPIKREVVRPSVKAEARREEAAGPPVDLLERIQAAFVQERPVEEEERPAEEGERREEEVVEAERNVVVPR